MKITKLHEDRSSFPKCCAKLSLITRKFWKGGGRPGNAKGEETCGHFASYKINDKYFCRKHGSLYVLDKVMESGEKPNFNQQGEK